MTTAADGLASKNTNKASDACLLYAHRGSTLLAPENTLNAFEMALAFGADVLEIDVRISRDNQVMVIHDERLDRTCNANGRVCDFTLSELERLDAAFHFTDQRGISYRNKGHSIVSLRELFERLPETRINIDIKDNTTKASQAVADVVKQCSREQSVTVGSFHAPVISHFRDCLPGVTTAASQGEVAALYFLRGAYRRVNFQYLQIPLQYKGIPLATRSFIRHAQQRGLKLVYWTINDKHLMHKLINLGVDGFVTDRVDIASVLLGSTAD